MAEAWRKRRHIAHFRSKPTDSDSEIAEAQSWLDFALKCGYLTQTEYDELNAMYEEVSGGLVRMMANAEQWCRPRETVREESADYELSE